MEDINSFPVELGSDVTVDNAIIVDINSSGFKTIGTWSKSNSIYYNDIHRSLFTKELDAKAIFETYLPSSGEYNVFIYNLYGTPTYDDTHIQIDITHSEGSEKIALNASEELKCAWTQIGTFSFNNGQKAQIKLSKLFEGDKVIRAGAVAFIPVQ